MVAPSSVGLGAYSCSAFRGLGTRVDVTNPDRLIDQSMSVIDECNRDISTLERVLTRLPPNSEQQDQSVGDDENNGNDQQLLPELSP